HGGGEEEERVDRPDRCVQGGGENGLEFGQGQEADIPCSVHPWCLDEGDRVALAPAALDRVADDRVQPAEIVANRLRCLALLKLRIDESLDSRDIDIDEGTRSEERDEVDANRRLVILQSRLLPPEDLPLGDEQTSCFLETKGGLSRLTWPTGAA